MKRSSLCFSLIHAASLGALATLLACGTISDPTKGDDVATVSGALTGADVPAGARVALVWRGAETDTYAVVGDTAIDNGRFTMPLAAPLNAYFFNPGDVFNNSTEGPGPVGGDPRSGAKEDDALATNVAPRNVVSGTVSEPLRAAIGGFVLYVDKNGNDKLDLSGSQAVSSDELIGGSVELMLIYLRGGTTEAYERLGRPSGAAPKAGFNLFSHAEGWGSLDRVQLELSTENKLPFDVCAPPSFATLGSGEPSGGAEKVGPGDGNYPSPDDPDLHCNSDGRVFVYLPSTNNCDSHGLCCVTERRIHSLDLDMSPPEGWPCTVSDPADSQQ